jgi:hypothetical protein
MRALFVRIRGPPVDPVRIDSEEVKIIHDLRKPRRKFDLENSLINVSRVRPILDAHDHPISKWQKVRWTLLYGVRPAKTFR